MGSRLEQLHILIAKAAKKLPAQERLEIGAQADQPAAIKEVVVLNQAQITTTAREREEDEELKDARKTFLDIARPYSQRAGKAKAASHYATLLMSLPPTAREKHAVEAREALKKRQQREEEEQLEGKDKRKKSDD